MLLHPVKNMKVMNARSRYASTPHVPKDQEQYNEIKALTSMTTPSDWWASLGRNTAASGGAFSTTPGRDALLVPAAFFLWLTHLNTRDTTSFNAVQPTTRIKSAPTYSRVSPTRALWGHCVCVYDCDGNVNDVNSIDIQIFTTKYEMN